jgi:hypothetical protein
MTATTTNIINNENNWLIPQQILDDKYYNQKKYNKFDFYLNIFI